VQQIQPPLKVFRSSRKTRDIIATEISQIPVANMTVYSSSVFDNFTAQVLECGIVVWRIHTDITDIFVFNEYSNDGDIVVSQFVHTTVENKDNQLIFSCTCNTFGLLCSLTLSALSSDTVSGDIYCMHCQLVRQHIMPLVRQLLCENRAAYSGLLHQKLAESQPSANVGVVTLLQSSIVSKYSTVSRLDGTCCMVHISHGIVSCQSGECQSRLRSRRSLKSVRSMEAAAKLCPHLEAMRAAQELWVTADVDSEEQAAEGDDDNETTNAEDHHLLASCHMHLSSLLGIIL